MFESGQILYVLLQFLNNDKKAAETVLEFEECDDLYIRYFEQVEHVWFETCDYGDLEVDDLMHPLVLFEGLLRNESFVNELITRKIDPSGNILLFLKCEHVNSPLFNLGMVEKWYASQTKLINDFSETADEDEERLKKPMLTTNQYSVSVDYLFHIHYITCQ